MQHSLGMNWRMKIYKIDSKQLVQANDDDDDDIGVSLENIKEQKCIKKMDRDKINLVGMSRKGLNLSYDCQKVP